MIQTKKLEAKEIFEIEKRPETAGLAECVSKEEAEALASLPWSYTVLSEEGRILAIGGIIPRWRGRAEAWAILAPKVRTYVPEITDFARAALDSCPINRIEVAVRCDFPEGHAWANALGFKAEAECLYAYDADGNDCSIYARVKDLKPRKKAN